MNAAAEFAQLFPAVYLRFHARSAKRATRLTLQMAAVLQHLSLSGPLTVGEMALHFERAQSVVSELVAGLVRHGLLERMPDARDRRRSLVWLTETAHERMHADRRVLCDELLAGAFARMKVADRAALIRGMRALVRAAAPPAPAGKQSTRRTR